MISILLHFITSKTNNYKMKRIHRTLYKTGILTMSALKQKHCNMYLVQYFETMSCGVLQPGGKLCNYMSMR